MLNDNLFIVVMHMVVLHSLATYEVFCLKWSRLPCFQSTEPYIIPYVNYCTGSPL